MKAIPAKSLLYEPEDLIPQMSVQGGILIGIKEGQIDVFVVVNIVVVIGVDTAGTEPENRSSSAEPSDVAVAVSVDSDIADVAAAAGSTQTYSRLRAVYEQVVGDQDRVGAPRFLGPDLDSSVAVPDCIADEIHVLCTVGINGEARVIAAVTVCDDVSEDKSVNGMIDRRGRVSVVAREADRDIAGVGQLIGNDIDGGNVGGYSDCLGPACLAVVDIVAEEKDI